MTIVFREDCEGLALGAVPVTAQWDEVTGTPSVVTTRARSGAKSVEFNGSNGLQTLSQLFGGGATKRYMRRSWWVNGRPTAGNFLTLQRLRDAAAATLAEVRQNTTGNLILRDGVTTVATSTSVVPLSTWWAATWAIDGTTQTLRYYTNPASDTAAETITGAYSGGTFSRVVDGCGNALNNLYLIGGDDWLDDDTTWPTVVAPPPSADTGLKKFALRGGVYVPLTTYSLGSSPVTALAPSPGLTPSPTLVPAG